MRLDKSFLENSFSLAGLPEALAEGLSGLARGVSLSSGEILFHTGDPGNGFYAVLEGSIKVSVISHEGEEQLLAVFGPGALVGELALLDGRPRSATVTALKPSRLAFIEKAAFARFGDANPAVYRHMLAVVGTRLRLANDVLAARSFLPLPGRVAQTLLQLAETFGKPLDNGRVLIHYKVSQANLANMAGAARENVNRVLSDWKRSGTISRISGYYCIENHDALKAASEI
ncbi:CRP-like cAMP-binding protein [Rhodobium orientis]|uniref:Cyclic nucleotide-binding protein n=1 Tax=Rhodobium orientis TaxID=34017 RepID=A0A327JT00_9HYPH|nr:Crp/Fnr family transcriptional regulator [Rhodobium orientis]MBB4304166.1 CRP-like cAMP-binding protein [Rhodobium orientis]MBK5950637.1 cyclic nucleotide-binding protein [Rhodobium orientis]RAI28022.1 cyclic nucleotide-binding protein [Rhodobium orientis]